MRSIVSNCRIAFGVALPFAAAVAACENAFAARQPNVVLILTDDQGSIDVNIYGAKDLFTPHMDAWAKRGVRFTQFYSAAPVCSPSRAGTLTGRVPPRAGVPGNVSSRKGSVGMPPEEVTIAEMLKAAGYATGHVGKWHLGYTRETMPNGQGFDESAKNCSCRAIRRELLLDQPLGQIIKTFFPEIEGKDRCSIKQSS